MGRGKKDRPDLLSGTGRRIGRCGCQCDSRAGRSRLERVQRDFWRRIASGVTTLEAAEAVGVSWPVGSRWFRHAGGMSPISLDEFAGRYLSFAEREEPAKLLGNDRLREYVQEPLAGSVRRTDDRDHA
jgi:hypothetical protein